MLRGNFQSFGNKHNLLLSGFSGILCFLFSPQCISFEKQGNEIDDVAAEELANALVVNSKLKAADFSVWNSPKNLFKNLMIIRIVV